MDASAKLISRQLNTFRSGRFSNPDRPAKSEHIEPDGKPAEHAAGFKPVFSGIDRRKRQPEHDQSRYWTIGS